MSQVTTLNAHSQLILKTYSVQRIREFSAHMELPVCQFYPFFFADGIVAAIQIDVEHGPIVAQIDLKVDLQAGMRLHHGCDQGKVLFYPRAKFGLIWRVCDEAFDTLRIHLGFERTFAAQQDALRP